MRCSGLGAQPALPARGREAATRTRRDGDSSATGPQPLDFRRPKFTAYFARRIPSYRYVYRRRASARSRFAHIAQWSSFAGGATWRHFTEVAPLGRVAVCASHRSVTFYAGRPNARCWRGCSSRSPLGGSYSLSNIKRTSWRLNAAGWRGSSCAEPGRLLTVLTTSEFGEQISTSTWGATNDEH